MINKKDEEFMESFIKLYFKLHELDLSSEEDKKSSDYNGKIISLENQIRKKLPQYSILFDNDLKILEKIFLSIAKEENINFISAKFSIFLKWTLKKIYEEKIIDKKTFDYLNSNLSKINTEISLSGSVLWEGT